MRYLVLSAILVFAAFSVSANEHCVKKADETWNIASAIDTYGLQYAVEAGYSEEALAYLIEYVGGTSLISNKLRSLKTDIIVNTYARCMEGPESWPDRETSKEIPK